MKNKALDIKRIFLSLITSILLYGITEAQDFNNLTKKQEQDLTKTKLKTHVMGLSTFNSFASYLYSIDLAFISTDNPEVAQTKLKSLPNPDLQISLRELFDEIGRQTSSKWSFDSEHRYWLFSKPLPFVIEIASGWKKEVRPGYLFFKPPSAPVGMDIYFAGKIDSSETEKDARIRIAKQYAERIIPNITEASMTEVELPNHNSLFLKTNIQSRGIIWRQWAFTEKGKCFVIVSAINENDDAVIFPDVELMVNSFLIIY